MSDDNTFMISLVAGLMILAFLLLFFGAEDIFVMQNRPSDRTGVALFPEDEISNSFISAQITKEFNMPIDSHYIFESGDAYLGYKYLYNGALFDANKFSYTLDADGANTGVLSFKVTKSNELAPLAISLNENIIEKKVYTPGVYNITLQNFRNNVRIDMYAESSGWKIWAPAVYQLENIKVKTDKFSTRFSAMDFIVLEKEFRNFVGGRIEFVLSENAGEADIELNGQKIHSGVLRNTDSVFFSRTDIQEGLNSLVISPKPNSRFSGIAKLLIFYDLDGAIVSVPIDMSKTQYSGFSKGEIKFTVDDVVSQGNFTLKLVRENGETIIAQNVPVIDHDYVYIFNKSDISPGINDIIIVPTNSIFVLKDFRLILR